MDEIEKKSWVLIAVLRQGGKLTSFTQNFFSENTAAKAAKVLKQQIDEEGDMAGFAFVTEQ